MPNTGDRYNGMVTSADPNYPKGFRDSQGIEPEPRIGVAWDITGNNKTALHASAGVYHNPHVNANGMDAMARNPPAQNTPSIFYATMDTLLVAGARARSRTARATCSASSATRSTPTSYNYSIGVQRELGWGTVLDVTYAGFQMRHAEIAKSINSVPDGARLVDINPQNANPQNPTTAKPNEFLRPVHRATRTSPSASTTARATTTRCRCSSIAATSAACSSRSRIPSRRPSPTARGRGSRARTPAARARRGTKVRPASPSCTTS